jgi:hypothetical protein
VRAERPGDLRYNKARVGDRSELDEEDAALELRQERPSHIHGKARLANSSGTREGHQSRPAALQQIPHLLDFSLPADNGGGSSRKVGVVEALQRGERAPPQLEQPLGLREIAGSISARVACDRSTCPP